MSLPAELDQIDLKILDVIQKNPPLSSTELAERIGLSQSPCWRRLTRLKEAGYILDRPGQLNAERLGYRTIVFCQIKLSAHGRTNLHEFIEAVARIPEVLEIYSTMGSFDFLLKVVTGDVADFRQITFGRILTLPTVQECNSTIALGVEKLSTALPIRAA